MCATVIYPLSKRLSKLQQDMDVGMILTETRELTQKNNPYARAGKKQEDAVAFYLRRAFSASEDVFVFNDLLLKHEGETAQMDHLVVHTFGFVIIESKSIMGEVKVNSQGEWSRSYKGRWSGMASPILQAQLQSDILRAVLMSNAEKLLDRMLLGLVQAGFSKREIATYCAVSNSAILHRENMTKKTQDQVVKAEALVELLKKKCSKTRGYLSAEPDFNANELKRICDFLLEQNCRPDLAAITESVPFVDVKIEDVKEVQPAESFRAIRETVSEYVGKSKIPCKHCGEVSQLNPSYGRFGYFLVCGACGKNTPLKHNCLECQAHAVKISKKGDVYSANCAAGHSYRVV